MITQLSKNLLLMGLSCLLLAGCRPGGEPQPETRPAEEQDSLYAEEYRPQFHFSPREHWMNDPNGLVFYEGEYHLFYQYHPESTVWGPMHWGHAVSKDLIFWEHKPVALYPDENGYIFSGSAIADLKNSSGFGSRENPPLLAVFTYHNAKAEEEGAQDYQTQGIAYSLDQGAIWTKYENNPVIANKDGLKDFRDPKVFWDEERNRWVMVLVAGDHARFYRSANLKDWTYMSDFGQDSGAHGGVWECPDLFPLSVDGEGEQKWVLLISINPGAPNGGSGTQYFIGDFDGSEFRTDQKDARWLDWGTDNYAGITYNNTPAEERVFIGWMSNWLYAQETPTKTWRSAMTVPRSLSLRSVGDTLSLYNYPHENLDTLIEPNIRIDLRVPAGATDRIEVDNFNEAEVRFKTNSRDFILSFENEAGEKLMLNMDGSQSRFILDRKESGLTDFQQAFANSPQQMPVDRLPEGEYEVRMLLDRSSIEIFINGGQYVMTAQIFPGSPYTALQINNRSEQPLLLNDFEVNGIRSIWRQ